MGKGSFMAGDRQGRFGWIVASVEILTPQAGVAVPGVPVMPYSTPHAGFGSLVTQQGLASDVKFLDIIPKEELARQIGLAYTAGPVIVEEFVYGFKDRQGRASKGYSFGISYGSRLGYNWRLWHMTATGPADQFDDFAPNFAAMFQSYAIQEKFAAEHIAKGTARLRQLQQETMRLVSRNAEEIRQTMQAAYDERQRSQDYIDYQRSNYIRGEQDWVSEVEGGAIYRTDTWGSKNTDTGESWEGRRYDYVHFKGDNPKYNELMTPIDTRELWEQLVRNR